ncbi:MAG TPA: membrane protein insertase YidC [Polyangia bacterium]|nr:membrane protein insertase YidC [Polyangia bacterium]
MEKRVILAIALCVAVIIFWSKFFPARPPTPAPSPSAATAPATEPSREPGPPPGGTASAAPAAATVNHPEQRVVVETPDVHFVFSSLGGTLLHAKLRGAKFLDRPNDPASGHDLVQSIDPKDAPLRTTFPNSGFAAPADGAWDVKQPAPNTVVFSTDSGSVHIEKRYTVDTTRYRLHLQVSLTNRGDQPVEQHLALSLTGRQDPDRRGGGFMSGSSANPASMVCLFDDDKIERRPIDKLGKDPIDKLGAIKWIGSDEKFFLLAAVPYPEPTPAERRCATSAPNYGTGEITLSFAGRTIAPHASTEYAFAIFDGPKYIADLDAVQPAGEEVKLDKAVDVTLAILSRPILSLLKFFHSFAHNWGLAIILLTLFIKLVTFYPTQKSLLSAKKMQKLAPKMNAIRKKYENDRQRQSVETMNLYKAHGVSPFGGCLPSLIQMPIWIALYSTLNYAVELYRAPFFGHIHDLTAKDPFYITPLLMGGVMFAQMRMSPSGADQQQQQMMSLMMPVMFTAFSLFLPAGLALYMLTSYLIGILQQLYINHLDRKGATAV